MNDGQLTPELLNQAFFDAEQYINPVIADRSKRYTSIWRSQIGRGTFQYGEGYTMKSREFYGGLAIQDSTRTWEAMQPSRAADPATGDPGYDACRYSAPVIGYGMKEKQFTIYQTARRTTDICLTDILFKWQFKQQLNLMYSMLSDITLGEWENWLRETYVNLSTKFLCTTAMEEFTMPMGGDSIDMSAFDMTQVGQLNQDILDRLYMYMYRQCPMASLSQSNGMPTFGLITSAETSQELITKDPTAVLNFRDAAPQVLIEGYGATRTYKGFNHIHDPMTMRFKVDAADPTTLIRVWPYKQEPSTIGDSLKIDPDYINAPFELSVVLLKNVFKALVPPTPPTSLGGMSFDSASNMGDFKWINIKDRENNLLGEKGFFFARFRAAPEPGEYSEDAVCILHRRCTNVEVVVCNTATTKSGSAQNILSVADYDSDATVNTKVIVTLAAAITAEIGDAVTVTDANSDAHSGVVVDDSGDARYVIEFAAVDTGGWADEILDGVGTPTVVTA